MAKPFRATADPQLDNEHGGEAGIPALSTVEGIANSRLPPAGFDRPQCLQTAPEIEAIKQFSLNQIILFDLKFNYFVF
jgi:hypothetical protein